MLPGPAARSTLKLGWVDGPLVVILWRRDWPSLILGLHVAKGQGAYLIAETGCETRRSFGQFEHKECLSVVS